jgi:AcrR family transcriptional regulator
LPDLARPTSRAVRLSAADRRAQLLDVTKRIVGDDGLHAVSIDRVAREAGISRPVVYEHFSNLSGLLHSLLAHEAECAGRQLATVLQRLAPDGRDPAGLLLDALEGYLEVVRSEPVTWRLVLTPPEGAPAVLRARIEQTRGEVVAQIANLLSSAFARSGGQTSPDTELTAHSMAALADYWSRLMLADPGKFTVERFLVHARWALSRFTR